MPSNRSPPHPITLTSLVVVLVLAAGGYLVHRRTGAEPDPRRDRSRRDGREPCLQSDDRGTTAPTTATGPVPAPRRTPPAPWTRGPPASKLAALPSRARPRRRVRPRRGLRHRVARRRPQRLRHRKRRARPGPHRRAARGAVQGPPAAPCTPPYTGSTSTSCGGTPPRPSCRSTTSSRSRTPGAPVLSSSASRSARPWRTTRRTCSRSTGTRTRRSGRVDAATGLPAATGFRCTYVAHQVAVKTKVPPVGGPCRTRRDRAHPRSLLTNALDNRCSLTGELMQTHRPFIVEDRRRPPT